MHRLLANSARKHASRIAIVENGHSFSYQTLFEQSRKMAQSLKDLGVTKGDRVAIYGEKSFNFCASQLAVWQLGGISLTLLPSYPAKELSYYLKDSQAKLVVASRADPEIASTFPTVDFLQLQAQALLHANDNEEEEKGNDTACLFYTSGSTGMPKGVVTSHLALASMISGMQSAWQWSQDDHILHFLPLHHVHGFVNKLMTPLCSGAKVEFCDFDPSAMWTRLKTKENAPTVFMGVPTIYAKLLAAVSEPTPLPYQRLFVCGSAPLRVDVFNRFQVITGHTILERYGMTEIGMALSNPLVGKRLPGYVGLPMPGIQVKIVDDSGMETTPGTPGDLLVKGDSVFHHYWNRTNTQEEEFVQDNFFKTGDVALFDPEANSFKIVGRKSVDVIKSGGFKISALEIEQVLLSYPGIVEVAVLGVADEVWGEIVVAVIVGSPACQNADLLQSFASQHLAKYKIPKKFVFLPNEIPKNAMGKVNKKQLRLMFE